MSHAIVLPPPPAVPVGQLSRDEVRRLAHALSPVGLAVMGAGAVALVAGGF